MTVLTEDFGIPTWCAQLLGDCVLAHAAQDHDADQTDTKVAVLDEDGWLQLKLQSQILVKASVAQWRPSQGRPRPIRICAHTNTLDLHL